MRRRTTAKPCPYIKTGYGGPPRGARVDEAPNGESAGSAYVFERDDGG
jgi:hypothetical protein